MTIRLAPATQGSHAAVSRWVHALLPARPANDNGCAQGDERMLWEALRHFADHGLHAALEAAESAQAALDAGDEEGFEWWLSICRMLDRPLGDRLARVAASNP